MPDERPVIGTGPTYTEILNNLKIEDDDDGEGEYGAEEEDDEESYGDEESDGEEGGDAEGAAEEYGDYDEEEETEPWPPKDEIKQDHPLPDRFFLEKDDLRSKYDYNEIDAFMRLLSMKPTAQWQDQAGHHYKLGLHNYEDHGQELDPDFHMLSEAERVEHERQQTREWRSGTEVKFQLGEKKPTYWDYRF